VNGGLAWLQEAVPGLELMPATVSMSKAGEVGAGNYGSEQLTIVCYPPNTLGRRVCAEPEPRGAAMAGTPTCVQD
jgi:hypothetical protein